MSTEYLDSTYTQIREVIQRLQSPVHDLPTLYALLSPPLNYLSILPPKFHRYAADPILEHGFNLAKHIPPLQRALLEHVLPAWGPAVDQDDAFPIVQQYFAPDLFSFAGSTAREIAIYAYSTIPSLPLTEYSVRLLAILAKYYPVDVLWDTISHGRKKAELHKHLISWEDCIKDVCSVPSKVANAFGTHLKGIHFPQELEFGTYFNNISIRFASLLFSVQEQLTQDDLSSLSYLLTKLANIGVFPPTRPSSSTQPSFWQTILPSVRSSLLLLPSSTSWCSLLAAISSSTTMHTILVSLASHLEVGSLPINGLDGSKGVRGAIKRESMLLRTLLGALEKDGDISEVALSMIVGRQWTIGHARTFVAWAAGSGTETTDFKGLQLLLNRVIEVWTASDHVKHSLLAQHQYITALMLLAVSYFPKSSSPNMGPHKLATSPTFIRSISIYISHLDASVRRCGMLVAEEVAHVCGKKLDFGDWDGDNDGREWCRDLRGLMKERDMDATVTFDLEEVAAVLSEGTPRRDGQSEEKRPRAVEEESEHEPDSDDDSIVGYASSDASSEHSSPQFTPAELEEIEKDPTLNVGRPKVPRPMYLGQLGELVRPTNGLKSEEENIQVVRTEIALDVGEELIRRKRAYGTELEENAVNLTYGFVALQDNYDIKGFAEKRQVALTALVACCPKKAAPAIIEQFFMNQYSAEQRYAMLNALALGARELALLPVPGPTAEVKRIAFPSKRLPPPLHQRYITLADEHPTNPVQGLLEGITKKVIESSRAAAEEKVPEIVRERRLRVKQPAKVTEVDNSAVALANGVQSMQLQPQPMVAFTEVAGEFFVCPMINRFWQFLRDEQAREMRTAQRSELHRYRGASTGRVLNAFVLAQFVATLAVLVHAAHNAPEWLAVLGPDALELAVTLGTRPLSQGEGFEDEDDEENTELNGEGGRGRKEAALLTNCLELATVVVDGALELDDGKSFALEHAALLLGAGEWGSEILSRLEKGMKILGGGGKQEMQLRRAAAGLVLKIDEVTSRWKRSMVAVGYQTF